MFFKFLNNTHETHTGAYNTQQMPLSVQNWRIVDYETKILNVISAILLLVTLPLCLFLYIFFLVNIFFSFILL